MRDTRRRSAATARRARAAAPATGGPGAARSCGSRDARAARRVVGGAVNVTGASAGRRASRPCRCAASLPARWYSIARRSGPCHDATTSFHAPSGRSTRSLRTSSRVTRHSATSLSHPDAQKSAVTRYCRSGDSIGSAGSRTCRPLLRITQQEARAVAVGREQHDAVDAVERVPQRVGLRAGDAHLVAERRDAGREQRDAQLVAVARGEPGQPRHLPRLDEPAAVRLVLGRCAERRDVRRRRRRRVRGDRARASAAATIASARARAANAHGRRPCERIAHVTRR